MVEMVVVAAIAATLVVVVVLAATAAAATTAVVATVVALRAKLAMLCATLFVIQNRCVCVSGCACELAQSMY